MFSSNILIFEINLEEIIELARSHMERGSITNTFNYVVQFSLFITMFCIHFYINKEFKNVFLKFLILMSFILFALDNILLRSQCRIDIPVDIKILFIVNSPLLSLRKTRTSI